jgi:hypothetical protein
VGHRGDTVWSTMLLYCTYVNGGDGVKTCLEGDVRSPKKVVCCLMLMVRLAKRCTASPPTAIYWLVTVTEAAPCGNSMISAL